MKRTLLSCMAALLSVPALALAQGSPTIRMVLGVPPGGSADATARIVASRMQEVMKRSVIVENRAGANMLIATKLVSGSAPDGSTLLMATAGPMTTNPVFYPKEPVNPLTNLTPISMIVTSPLAVMVNADLPLKSLRELVTYAKANPGQLNYSTGTTSFQIAMEMLMQETGIRLTHVPYGGAAPALNAVAAGQVQLTILDIGTSKALIRAGKLRVLMMLSDKRVKSLPDVPSAVESGFPRLEMDTWVAVFGPPGMPPALVGQLNDAMAKAMDHNEVREKFAAMEFEPLYLTPEQLAERIKKDSATFKEVIERVNLKPN